MRLRTAAGFPAAVFYRNSKHRKGRETVQSAMAACRRVWKLSSKAKAGCIFNVGAKALKPDQILLILHVERGC